MNDFDRTIERLEEKLLPMVDKVSPLADKMEEKLAKWLNRGLNWLEERATREKKKQR